MMLFKVWFAILNVDYFCEYLWLNHRMQAITLPVLSVSPKSVRDAIAHNTKSADKRSREPAT
jgi:heme exporter protein D